ncbi:MAG: hypothetical protein AAGG72_03380 [Pseudomonadota bacterium]
MCCFVLAPRRRAVAASLFVAVVASSIAVVSPPAQAKNQQAEKQTVLQPTSSQSLASQSLASANPPAPTRKPSLQRYGLRLDTMRPRVRGNRPGLSTRMKRKLSRLDRRATLATIRIALDHVADGARYKWQRQGRRLGGEVRLLSSYLGPTGNVCRHFQVSLASSTRSGHRSSHACKAADGRWHIGNATPAAGLSAIPQPATPDISRASLRQRQR